MRAEMKTSIVVAEMKTNIVVVWMVCLLGACGGNLLERATGMESAAQCYERAERQRGRFDRVMPPSPAAGLFTPPECKGGLTHEQVFALDRHCPGLLKAGQNVQVGVARCTLDARRALPGFLSRVGQAETLVGDVNRGKPGELSVGGIGSVVGWPGVTNYPPQRLGPPPSVVPLHNARESVLNGSACGPRGCNPSAVRWGLSHYTDPKGQTTSAASWFCPTCQRSGTTVERSGPDGFTNYRSDQSRGGGITVRGEPDRNTDTVRQQSQQALIEHVADLNRTKGKH
jgi:hypothetical protein